jgi:peptide/nickel transport system substrate-binding protein
MNVLNVTKPPLDDLNVRRAIAYATDRLSIVDTLFKGVYLPAYGPLEKSTFGYDPAVEKMYPFDLGKAKALLEEAGWKPGPGGIRVKDGKPLETLFVVQTNDQWDEVAQMWQAQLREAGINMKITFESSPTVFATYNKGIQHFADFFFWSPDPVFLFAMYHSKSIPSNFNWAHYSNPDVDRMIEASMAEGNAAKRAALIRDIQKKVLEDATIVSIHSKRTVMALDSKLDGLAFTFQTYPYFYDLHFTQ